MRNHSHVAIYAQIMPTCMHSFLTWRNSPADEFISKGFCTSGRIVSMYVISTFAAAIESARIALKQFASPAKNSTNVRSCMTKLH